jgi:hypothetical protein
MADYYPLLKQALASRETDADARVEIYARARELLSRELKKARPPRSSERVFAEHSALEKAIQRVEAENRGRRDVDAGQLTPRVAENLRPEVPTPVRIPRWPVLLAPFVAGVYYLAIKTAFAQSTVFVLGRSDFFDVPHWGPHWLYRIAAEVISVCFGTFIAAGLARGRERAAAVTGGCAIALGFAAKVGLTYLIWESSASVSVEPWYQRAIDGGMVLAAPFIAFSVIETAEQMHRDTPRGFGGINRLHFLWLWIIAYFYALGLITPLARWYAFQDDSTITMIILVLVNGIPAAAMMIPAYYGIALLSGAHGDTMHPAGRNLIGVLVLIFGLLVGLIVEGGWYWLVQTLHEIAFG